MDHYRISTYGCVLRDGMKPLAGNHVDLVVIFLLYSTVQGLSTGSGHSTALLRPQTPPSPPTITPNHLCWSHRMHPQDSQPLSLPLRRLLYSCTSQLTCFTLQCFKMVSEPTIWFTVNRLIKLIKGSAWASKGKFKVELGLVILLDLNGLMSGLESTSVNI